MNERDEIVVSFTSICDRCMRERERGLQTTEKHKLKSDSHPLSIARKHINKIIEENAIRDNSRDNYSRGHGVHVPNFS